MLLVPATAALHSLKDHAVLHIIRLLSDCFPDLITELANMMGIGTPINMLFFFGFCFSLMVIFVLTVVVSKLTVKVKRLTQEIAMFEEEMKKKLQAKEDCK